MEDGDGQESRFSHLLRPIRDLADNWDIDIAGELVDYLEELDKIVIDFSGGGDLNLNFAEAALVIQGSTAVYTKKVELLYRLVFEVLDMLCDAPDPRGVQAKSGANGKKGGSRRKSVAFAFGQEEKNAFLLLDDVIQVGNNINLDGGGEDDSKDKRIEGLRERVPFALIGTNVGAGPTTSNTNDAFKLISCDIGGDGAFILERSRTGQDNPFVRMKGKKFGMASLQNVPQGLNENDDDAEDPSDEEHLMFSDDNDDDHNDNGGIELYETGSPEQTVNLSGARPPSADIALADATSISGGTEAESDEEDENPVDPWVRLDPHENGSEEEHAPLKVGKTWKTPKTLANKAKAEGAGRVGEFSDDLLRNNLLISVALNPALAAKVPTLPNLVLYPELRSFAVARRKRLREQVAGSSKQAARSVMAKNKAEKDEEEEERITQGVFNDGAEDEHEEDYDAAANDFDYDGGGYGDDEDGGFQFNDNQDENAHSGPMSFGTILNSEAFDSAPSTYLGMVKQHLQKYLETANQWATESRLHTRVREWEEKIEPFLKAQNARPTFDIHLYGGRILQGLATQLREEEELEKNDESGGTATNNDHSIPFEDLSMHLGGDAQVSNLNLNRTVIDELDDGDDDGLKLKDMSNEKNAADKTQQQPVVDKSEVCRMFLASLQLANNGNVELVHAKNNTELRIKLLDNVLANERLHGYLAPSVKEANVELPSPNKKRAKGSKTNKPLVDGMENMLAA